MNCPQCQAPNQANSASCANCGAQLPAGAPAYSSGGYGAPSGYGPSVTPAGQHTPTSQQPAARYPAAGGQHQPQHHRPSGTAAPPYQFDMKRLTRVDQTVGVASLIVLISLFLPWFTVTVSSSVLGFSASGSGSGTDAHGWLWLVFVLDLFILAYLVMRAGWENSPVRLPVAHAPLLIAATGLQLLLVLIAFFVMPGTGGIAGVSVGWAWGAFVGLLAALAAAGPVIWPAVRSYMQSRGR